MKLPELILSPRSERVLAWIVGPPVLLILSPLLLLILLDKWKRKLVGPSSEWRAWFAWYPVRFDSGFGELRWFEWVERRIWYSRVLYRAPGDDTVFAAFDYDAHGKRITSDSDAALRGRPLAAEAEGQQRGPEGHRP